MPTPPESLEKASRRQRYLQSATELGQEWDQEGIREGAGCQWRHHSHCWKYHRRNTKQESWRYQVTKHGLAMCDQLDLNGTFSSKGQTAPSLSVDHKVLHKGIAASWFCMNTQIHRYTHRHTDRHTDRHKDRHTDRHTHTHTHGVCCNYLHIVLATASEHTQVRRNRLQCLRMSEVEWKDLAWLNFQPTETWYSSRCREACLHGNQKRG